MNLPQFDSGQAQLARKASHKHIVHLNRQELKQISGQARLAAKRQKEA